MMLSLDLVIIDERDPLPIQSSQSRKQNELWMLVDMDGKVSSSAGHAGESHGVGPPWYLDFIYLQSHLNPPSTLTNVVRIPPPHLLRAPSRENRGAYGKPEG